MPTYVMLTRVSGDALKDPAKARRNWAARSPSKSTETAFGHASTETWPATPWDRFKELLRPGTASGGAASALPKTKKAAA